MITAADAPTTRALADIAQACARDLGVPLVMQTSVARTEKTHPHPAPGLTLHLPVEFAASQHQVWCLACRLACFCTTARVSVLVLGQAFSAESSPAAVASRRA